MPIISGRRFEGTLGEERGRSWLFDLWIRMAFFGALLEFLVTLL